MHNDICERKTGLEAGKLKKIIYTVKSNEKIANTIYKMRMHGDTSNIAAPGQFINISIDGLFLRRPISICDWDEHGLTIVYKVVGKGTELLSEFKEGDLVDALSGLGNGFDVSACGSSPMVIGGGVGVPPLLGLAKALIAEGKSPVALLGFNSAEDVILVDEFKKIGVETHVATVDGSFGTKGFVTDLPMTEEYFYACGPLAMLKAVCSAAKGEGEISLEERMGCGFGACMGCSHKTKNGAKRVCKEGPVFKKGEMIW